jgi:hypothetical protein
VRGSVRQTHEVDERQLRRVTHQGARKERRAARPAAAAI